MIKVFTLVLFIANSIIPGYGQTKIVDSLKAVLESTNKPIQQFDALNELVLELVGWKGDNVDSTYCTQMLQIAQQLKNDSLLAISYNWLGSFFYLNKGDNATALEYFYKALPYAQKHNDKRRISSLYFDIALVYFDLQNLEEARLLTQKGGQNLPDKTHPLYDFMRIQYVGNMVDYFLRVEQLDSVFYYVNEYSKTVEKWKGSSYDVVLLIVNGAAHAMAGNLDLADENFSQALAELSSTESSVTNSQFYGYYIPYLLAHDRITEAGDQAKNLLNLGLKYKNNNLKLAGAGFLRQVFDKRNEIDSAYYYSQKEAAIGADIFSQNNKNRIQALAFSDQIRGMEEKARAEAYQNKLKFYGLLISLGVFFIIAFILYRNNRQKQKANKVLETTLSNLKSTQAQLIQSEKMASLGELTAGIAHEIQNPLNFVNNFSEVSSELIDETLEVVEAVKTRHDLSQKDALSQQQNSPQDNESLTEIKDLLGVVKSNLEKITHHGKRADSIVKGMLQHSRAGSGQKEATDINALADEYLRLSYHGLRAKDKILNADFKTDLDPNLPKVNIIPQDIGRVLLNLINNAFYAVQLETQNSASLQKTPQKHPDYKPLVMVSTKNMGNHVEIRVKDNGSGIPDAIKDKIFQPFFTTKPTGQGTGLGLSLSYDIVKAHGGTLSIKCKEGEGAEFIVQLSIT